MVICFDKARQISGQCGVTPGANSVERYHPEGFVNTGLAAA